MGFGDCSELLRLDGMMVDAVSQQISNKHVQKKQLCDISVGME
jgi:hypothetical protein